MTKRCNHCGEEKPIDSFGTDRAQHDGKCPRCIDCHREINHKSSANRKEHLKNYRIAHRDHYADMAYFRKYKITQADYDDLFHKQDGLCMICHKPNIKNQRLYVDHDHKTSKVRGLLCYYCNTSLGYVKEDANILRGMIAYLGESL